MGLFAFGRRLKGFFLGYDYQALPGGGWNRAPFYRRVEEFEFREKMYDGTLYRPREFGGMLEDIVRISLGGVQVPRRMRIHPWFNPVPQIVEAYQSIFPGRYGKGTEINNLVRYRPVNKKLIPTAEFDPIGDIWTASNLNTVKAVLIRWGANLGTVGLRVVADNTGDADPKNRRVWVQLDHPSRIVDFTEDARGNITDILLRYEIWLPEDLGDDNPKKIKVEERISAGGFSRTHDGVETLTVEQRANYLGFCPYVLLRHVHSGEQFGHHAYWGAEEKIHAINWRASRQDSSLDRHQFPKWFAAAAGPRPTNVDLGEDSVAYVQMQPDSPTPIMTPLVAQINQTDSMAYWTNQIEILREQCPEMILNSMRAISNISGETLAQLLKPAEARIIAARANYDEALIKAIQIALSMGIALGKWDLGTGINSSDSADRAYKTGLLDFEFKDRPALALSPYDRINSAKADSAVRTQGVTDAALAAPTAAFSQAEMRRWIGLTDEESASVEKELSEQDSVPPSNPDGFGGQNGKTVTPGIGTADNQNNNTKPIAPK